MGNSDSKKVVVFIEDKNSKDKRDKIIRDVNDLLTNQQVNCKASYRSSIDEFIQYQNPKDIKQVIVAEKQENFLAIQSQLTIEKNDIKNLEHTYPQKNNLYVSLKSKLIKYFKKNMLDIKIYVYIYDAKLNLQYKLPEHEKPFVKIITRNLQELMKEMMSQQDSNTKSNMKMDRLYQGLYRRVLVKMVGLKEDEKEENEDREKTAKKEEKKDEDKDKDENKEEKKDQYGDPIRDLSIYKDFSYSNMEKFEKSNISTLPEYVICTSEFLLQLIDVKKLRNHNYNIILKSKQNEYPLDQRSHKARHVYFQSRDQNEIVKKIRQDTNFKEEEMPQRAKNVIIVGNNTEFWSNKQILKRELGDHLEKKYKIRRQHVTILAMQKPDDLEQLGELVMRSYYSFVVTYTEDDLLTQVKKYLKFHEYNLSSRVQLTKVKLKDSSGTDLFQKKLHYLKNEIKYEIKFERSPVNSIYIFKESHQSQEDDEDKEGEKGKKDKKNKKDKENKEKYSEFFTKRIGINVHIIKDINIFFKYYLPCDLGKNKDPIIRRIVQSQHVLCDIATYKKIKRTLKIRKTKDDEYWRSMKVIIIDTKDKIMPFIYHNNDQEVVFVDDSLERIEDFIKYSQSSSVSIPFFQNDALSTFERAQMSLSAMNLNRISLETEITFSDDIDQLFKMESIHFSNYFNLELLIFCFSDRNFAQQINEFEQQFVTSYANLWYYGEELLTTDQNKNRKLLEFIKVEIANCLYKCKSYELLNVSDQDFYELYIRRVYGCQDFIELKLICLYFLSLPHNFNSVISNIFRNQRKSKMAAKIFIAYMLVVMTSFYNFGPNPLSKIQLIAEFSYQQMNEIIKGISERDIIYTTDFVFCTKARPRQNNTLRSKHSIIFEFENTNFEEESKLIDYIQFEKYAFYKEGADYLIPPFVKFEVKKKTFSKEGEMTIVMANVRNTQNSFIKKVLDINSITFGNILQAFKAEIQGSKKKANALKSYPENTTPEPKKQNEIKQNQRFFALQKQQQKTLYDNKPTDEIQKGMSFYKKVQKVELEQNKENFIHRFQSGLYYDQFFIELNKRKHFQARRYILQQCARLQDQYCVKTPQQENQRQMLGIQLGLLHYRLGEFGLALEQFLKVQKYVVDEDISGTQDGKWAAEKINSFMKTVEDARDAKIRNIEQKTKKKLWKISAHWKDDRKREITFKVRTKAYVWETFVEPNRQIFGLFYTQQLKKSDQKAGTQNQQLQKSGHKGGAQSQAIDQPKHLKHYDLQDILDQNILLPDDIFRNLGTKGTPFQVKDVFNYYRPPIHDAYRLPKVKGRTYKWSITHLSIKLPQEQRQKQRKPETYLKEYLNEERMVLTEIKLINIRFSKNKVQLKAILNPSQPKFDDEWLKREKQQRQSKLNKLKEQKQS